MCQFLALIANALLIFWTSELNPVQCTADLTLTLRPPVAHPPAAGGTIFGGSEYFAFASTGPLLVRQVRMTTLIWGWRMRNTLHEAVTLGCGVKT